jgi:hypothetical protein
MYFTERLLKKAGCPCWYDSSERIGSATQTDLRQTCTMFYEENIAFFASPINDLPRKIFTTLIRPSALIVDCEVDRLQVRLVSAHLISPLPSQY